MVQPLAGGDMVAQGASVDHTLAAGGDMVVQGASVVQPFAGGDVAVQGASPLPLPRPIAQVAQPLAGSGSSSTSSGLPQPMAKPEPSQQQLAGKNVESSIAPGRVVEEVVGPSTPAPMAGPQSLGRQFAETQPSCQPLAAGSGRFFGLVGVSSLAPRRGGEPVAPLWADLTDQDAGLEIRVPVGEEEAKIEEHVGEEKEVTEDQAHRWLAEDEEDGDPEAEAFKARVDGPVGEEEETTEEQPEGVDDDVGEEEEVKEVTEDQARRWLAEDDD